MAQSARCNLVPSLESPPALIMAWSMPPTAINATLGNHIALRPTTKLADPLRNVPTRLSTCIIFDVSRPQTMRPRVVLSGHVMATMASKSSRRGNSVHYCTPSPHPRRLPNLDAVSAPPPSHHASPDPRAAARFLDLETCACLQYLLVSPASQVTSPSTQTARQKKKKPPLSSTPRPVHL